MRDHVSMQVVAYAAGDFVTLETASQQVDLSAAEARSVARDLIAAAEVLEGYGNGPAH